MSEGPEWFAPKRYGYGSGLPVSWQGWALTIGYAAVALGLAWALRERTVELVAALALPTVAFIVICAKTTRGRWRWRWGKEE